MFFHSCCTPLSVGFHTDNVYLSNHCFNNVTLWLDLSKSWCHWMVCSTWHCLVFLVWHFLSFHLSLCTFIFMFTSISLPPPLSLSLSFSISFFLYLFLSLYVFIYLYLYIHRERTKHEMLIAHVDSNTDFIITLVVWHEKFPFLCHLISMLLTATSVISRFASLNVILRTINRQM